MTERELGTFTRVGRVVFPALMLFSIVAFPAGLIYLGCTHKDPPCADFIAREGEPCEHSFNDGVHHLVITQGIPLCRCADAAPP